MYVTKPEVTDKYIRIPVRSRKPNDRIRTITISASKGIKALYAGNRKVILTYLFLRSKGWTMTKAKKWVKEHSKNKSMGIKKTIENKEEGHFTFAMPILKCYEEIRLDDKNKEIKEKFIEGVASSTDIDLHGDQMAPSAIKSMAQSIKDHIIQLNAEHDKSWQSELGGVTKLSIDKKNKLVMKAKLDITSKANDLWYALTVKKKELGLSIGGFVKDYVLEWDKKKEQFKRIYKEIELDHIAVTSTPANPKTWVGAIAKAMDKVARNDKLKSLENMSKENLIEFVEKTLSLILGEDNLKKLLTNFSLNFNEEMLMAIKKQKSSLESDKLKKAASADAEDKGTKNVSESKDDAKEDDEKSSETPDNEDESKDNESKKDDSEDNSSDEDENSSGEDEEDESDSDDSEDDKDEEDDSKKADSSDEDDEDSDDESDSDEDDEEEEEEKSLTREEVADMVSKGIKDFFSSLLGKKSEDKEDDSNEDNEAEKSQDNSVDLLKTIVQRQGKIEKLLKKKSANRKGIKGVVLNKNEETDEEEEGVFKTMEEELTAVKKQYVNDSEQSFIKCGQVRRKWEVDKE